MKRTKSLMNDMPSYMFGKNQSTLTLGILKDDTQPMTNDM